MLKIASRILDVYDDADGEVAKLLPKEAHQFKVAEQKEIEELTDKQFALIMKTADGSIRRRLPLHNEDSLKISQAYFNTIKESLPVELVKAAEEKFANPGNGKVAYVDLSKVEPPREKIAYAEKHYGLTIEGKDCFPLHDATLVKLAVNRFPFTINDLHPEERFLYARNIEKRASALNVEIPFESPINLYTSNEVNLDALKRGIEQRKAASALNHEVLDQLAMAVGCPIDKGAIESEDSFTLRQAKLASMRRLPTAWVVNVLQTFDKLAGLGSTHYLRGLLDPFASCFKKASCPGNNCMVDGIDLSKIDALMLEGKFEDDFISSFIENPVQVYKSLPDPVKSVVRQIAQNAMSGKVPPTPERCAKNTASLSAGDPTDDLGAAYVNGQLANS